MRLVVVNAAACCIAAACIAAACGSGAPAREPPAAAPPAASPPAPPSCEEALSTLRNVAIEASGASDDEERAYVARYVDDSLAKLRKECETEPWPPSQRRCVHAARDERAMLACDREAAIARGEDMGGPACEQVADHLTKVSIDPIGTTPEHREELRDRFATYCQAWPRKHKECVLAATSQDAITSCGQP